MTVSWRFRVSGLMLAGVTALGMASGLRAADPAGTPAAKTTDAPLPPAPSQAHYPQQHPTPWNEFEFTPPPHVRASSEVLLWWVRGAPAPPLVTTGPTDTLGPGQRPGTLGLPGTQTLIEGPFDYGAQAGGRFSIAAWLDSHNTLGLEGTYCVLATNSASRYAGSTGLPGDPALAVPFVDATLNQENSTGIAFPRAVNAFGGQASVTANLRLQSAEVNGAWNVVDSGRLRFDLLAGFRYIALDERLTLDTQSVNVPPAQADIFGTRDRFRTENDYYAGQIGARAEYRWDCFYVQATGKLAFGTMYQHTEIFGLLQTNDFTNLTTVQRFRGGYLALPTNIGDYGGTRTSVVPELGTQVGLQPLEWIRIFVSYNFLYVSNVVRPGDQIDRVINPTQGPAFTNSPSSVLAGPARPTYLGRESDLWAHGLSFGIELRY